MLSFVDYLSQFANQHNSIAFKMIDGETQFLFAPWEIGKDFIAGRDERAEPCALRFEGIVRISPGPRSHP